MTMKTTYPRFSQEVFPSPFFYSFSRFHNHHSCTPPVLKPLSYVSWTVSRILMTLASTNWKSWKNATNTPESLYIVHVVSKPSLPCGGCLFWEGGWVR